MRNITRWAEEVAVAKEAAGLITPTQLQEASVAFNAIRRDFNRMSTSNFQEVLTASGFNTYMTDALSRSFYDQYGTVGGTWRNYTYADQSPDLREVTRYRRTDSHRMVRRRATGSRKEFSTDIDKEQYGASEFSEQFSVAWETILNDDLNELIKMPTDMANVAANFEDEFVSSLYNNATTQAYLIGLGAGYSSAAALTTASLSAGITAMTGRRSNSNALIKMGAIRLVIGQGLVITAADIMSNIFAGTTDANQLNKFIGGVDVDPYLVASGGFEPWYLFADPRVIPTVPVLRLSGTDRPYVFTQESQVRLISGSAPAALTLGSYDSGVVSYSVGSIIGGNASDTKGGLIDEKGIYYSSGGA